MKRKLFYILFAGLGGLNLTSCDKKTEVLDKDIAPPAYAKFNTLQAADTIKTYYVLSNNAPIKIPVGITSVSNQERTVNFKYSSNTAVAGQQYNGPASLLFPANKVVDSLSFTGLFSGYPSPNRVDTVKIEITGGGVPANAYKNNFYLIMRKYCDVALNSFAGDFDNTLEYSASGAVSWGPYTTTVRNITTTGATSGTAIIDNIYDYGGSVNATFNWDDPAKFTVTIPEQNTGVLVSSGGVVYALWIRTNGTTSTFSSCNNTITLFIDAIAKNPTTGATAGSFSTNYRIVLNR